MGLALSTNECVLCLSRITSILQHRKTAQVRPTALQLSHGTYMIILKYFKILHLQFYVRKWWICLYYGLPRKLILYMAKSKRQKIINIKSKFQKTDVRHRWGKYFLGLFNFFCLFQDSRKEFLVKLFHPIFPFWPFSSGFLFLNGLTSHPTLSFFVSN